MTPVATRLAGLLALVAAGCSGRPPEPPPTPPNVVATIREQHLPNIELVTHEGRRVRFYDDLVKGRVVAINFMFATCRNACPESTQHLVEVQHALGDRMGRDVTFLDRATAFCSFSRRLRFMPSPLCIQISM